MLERFERFTEKDEYDGFFWGLYKRNEFLLIISAAVFFGSLFIGYFLAGFVDQILASSFNSFKDSISKGQIQLTTLSIFKNNLTVALRLYGFGIFFGVFTLLILAYQGLFIGYVASKFSIGDFIISTLPHGVFELPGIIIAGAAGLRLASTVVSIIRDLLEIKRYLPLGAQLKHILNLNYPEFKESLKLLAVAVVLILIAAYIEANLTIPWIKFVKGG
ncbi:MAG TPA: stage II sporulation protein M [Methanobacterium sp.]|nr:stage II sporulation protein M [Methanobacterium sp.]